MRPGLNARLCTHARAYSRAHDSRARVCVCFDLVRVWLLLCLHHGQMLPRCGRNAYCKIFPRPISWCPGICVDVLACLRESVRACLYACLYTCLAPSRHLVRSPTIETFYFKDFCCVEGYCALCVSVFVRRRAYVCVVGTLLGPMASFRRYSRACSSLRL